MTYVDAGCPVCGDPAVPAAEATACNNEPCPEHGRVRENGDECPGADGCLRETGE